MLLVSDISLRYLLFLVLFVPPCLLLIVSLAPWEALTLILHILMGYQVTILSAGAVWVLPSGAPSSPPLQWLAGMSLSPPARAAKLQNGCSGGSEPVNLPSISAWRGKKEDKTKSWTAKNILWGRAEMSSAGASAEHPLLPWFWTGICLLIIYAPPVSPEKHVQQTLSICSFNSL